MPTPSTSISEISIPISEILVLNQGILDAQKTAENLVSRLGIQPAWAQERTALIELIYQKGLLSHDGAQVYWDALIMYGKEYRLDYLKGRVEWLEPIGLLKRKECFSFLTSRNFSPQAVSLLLMLRRNGILDLSVVKLNLDVIAEHEDREYVVKAIQDLAKEGLAEEGLWSRKEDKVFLSVILKSNSSGRVIKSFSKLNEAGILKSFGVRSNLEAICSQYGVLDAVQSLDKRLLIDEKQAETYVKALIDSRSPNDIVNSLNNLYFLSLKVPLVKEKCDGIISRMQRDMAGPETFIYALELLHEVGLLNDEQQAQANLDAIINKKVFMWSFARSKSLLEQKGLWNSRNAQLILKHRSPSDSAEVLVHLHGQSNVQIVTENAENAENFDALMRHIEKNTDRIISMSTDKPHIVYAKKIIHVIQILSQENGLLSGEGAQKNFNVLMEHQQLYTSRLIDVIVTLHAKGVLNGDIGQEIFDKVLAHRSVDSVVSLAKGINYLSEKNLLSDEEAQANLNLVLGHKNPRRMALTLVILNIPAIKVNPLIQENRVRILTHPFPYDIAFAVQILLNRKLLQGEVAQKNLNAIFETSHHHLEGLCHLLELLTAVRLLDQTCFDGVIRYSNILCHNKEVISLWENNAKEIIVCFKNGTLSWKEIIRICEQHQENIRNAISELVGYVSQCIKSIQTSSDSVTQPTALLKHSVFVSANSPAALDAASAALAP